MDAAPPGSREPRPVHLRWSSLGLVAAGGAVGTGLRGAVALLVPTVAGVPVATFAVNIVGAFLLGLLVETLTRGGTPLRVAQRARLLLGTGVLGGFTTYSAFAVETFALGGASLGIAVAYALGTVLVGAAATFGGIRLGAAIARRRA